eukprot:TRINITY_DN1615_c0_g4_i1.p1 TRINITY_DN1615_c0_g4~~TRINITY_DN1615_c0_g4_i1.p1  ORF type:complete len:118 (+),score=13.94 TRINITY_DN1615_c0_g4_i1:44-355(+)
MQMITIINLKCVYNSLQPILDLPLPLTAPLPLPLTLPLATPLFHIHQSCLGWLLGSASTLLGCALPLFPPLPCTCLLYTSDAADDSLRVDLGGRRIIKKKKKK